MNKINLNITEATLLSMDSDIVRHGSPPPEKPTTN